MHEALKNQILRISAFSEEELERISASFRPHSFKAKEYMLREGNTCSDIHFIINGLVRVYHLRDDKEVNTYLACDEGFISSYSSFLSQSPSRENMHCLEATETLSVSFSKMAELYRTIPQWQMVGRVLAEQNYLCMADRVLQLQHVAAKDKYEVFLQSAPAKIVQRTPLIHIASFLGIAPESLSRIRKSIS